VNFRAQRNLLAAIAESTSGSVFPEYLVVVGVCAIVVAGAIASLGIPLVTGYNTARQVLIAPTP
jgi:hypothetical protein